MGYYAIRLFGGCYAIVCGTVCLQLASKQKLKANMRYADSGYSLWYSMLAVSKLAEIES